jgi:hypothetical protein
LDTGLTDSNTVEYETISLSELRAGDPNNDYLTELLERPLIDPNLVMYMAEGYVMYMAEGVDDFTIQLGLVLESGNVVWWPQYDEQAAEIIRRPGRNPALIEDVGARAVKFTFTLYDSRGIIRDGKTFTHIVYVGD